MADFQFLRIVLCQTSHPGNIGATARAMKNMGLKHLTLVNPLDFPSDHANARASGADDILQQASVVNSLQEAIQDCKLVLGTSARHRNLPQALLTPREMASHCHAFTSQAQQVALVFGHERNGLSNEELALCHIHVHIPCNPDFSSLNLAAAVQVLCYECFLAFQTNTEKPQQYIHYDDLADSASLEGFYEHLAQTLTEIEFLEPAFPKRIMPKLRRLFGRTQLEATELNILRGILSAINRKFRG